MAEAGIRGRRLGEGKLMSYVCKQPPAPNPVLPYLTFLFRSFDFSVISFVNFPAASFSGANFYPSFKLYLLQIKMLQMLYQLIQSHSNNTENNDRCNYHIELKYLRTVNDQISQAPSCG